MPAPGSAAAEWRVQWVSWLPEQEACVPCFVGQLFLEFSAEPDLSVDLIFSFPPKVS